MKRFFFFIGLFLTAGTNAATNNANQVRANLLAAFTRDYEITWSPAKEQSHIKSRNKMNFHLPRSEQFSIVAFVSRESPVPTIVGLYCRWTRPDYGDSTATMVINVDGKKTEYADLRIEPVGSFDEYCIAWLTYDEFAKLVRAQKVYVRVRGADFVFDAADRSVWVSMADYYDHEKLRLKSDTAK